MKGKHQSEKVRCKAILDYLLNDGTKTAFQVYPRKDVKNAYRLFFTNDQAVKVPIPAAVKALVSDFPYNEDYVYVDIVALAKKLLAEKPFLKFSNTYMDCAVSVAINSKNEIEVFLDDSGLAESIGRELYKFNFIEKDKSWTAAYTTEKWLFVTNLKDESCAEVSLAATEKPKTASAYEQVRKLIAEKGTERSAYTESDFELLKSYEGAGGLAKEGVVAKGILNEFYTPEMIIKAMYGLAVKHGYTGGKMLEPSCGIGRFFKYLDSGVKAVGYEIDATSATIAQLLYPWAEIRQKSFERHFYSDHNRALDVVADFDLVMANPPYDVYKSLYSRSEKATMPYIKWFYEWFMFRSLDVLKSGGLACFIIPSAWMRNENAYNHAKIEFEKKCELLEAYRLPNDSFPNTYIGTDIILVKKK